MKEFAALIARSVCFVKTMLTEMRAHKKTLNYNINSINTMKDIAILMKQYTYTSTRTRTCILILTLPPTHKLTHIPHKNMYAPTHPYPDICRHNELWFHEWNEKGNQSHLWNMIKQLKLIKWYAIKWLEKVLITMKWANRYPLGNSLK